MKANEYQCEYCQQVYEKEWSDAEADAEYQQLFPESAKREEPRGIVCDDCFKKMTTELPPAQAEADYYELSNPRERKE